MKQIIIIFYIIAFFAFNVQSQDVTEYRFSVLSSKGEKINGKKLYLADKEGPFIDEYIHDGIVAFCLDEKTSLNDIYIVLKQSDNHFSRIKLTYFTECGLSINLPSMIVKLIEKRIIKDEIATIPIANIPQEGIISKEEFKFRYGSDSLFFPAKLLVGYDTAYSNMISQAVTFEKFYSQYQYYPKKEVIDSLKEAAILNLGEQKARWLSWQLIQLNEPILCRNIHKNVYRYEWCYNGTKNLTYNPYSIRIEPTDLGKATMYCSYSLSDFCGNYQIYCDVIPVNEINYSYFISLIAKLDFYEKDSVLGSGETSSILEANINGQYHVIFRGEGEDPALDELQKFLWSLTGLGENKIIHKRLKIE